MAKSLNDILKRYSDALSGKRSSTVNALTTGDNPGVDYADKMKDTRDFIAQHSVEKFDDRVGNGDDVYNASKVEKAKMERHGHEPKPKDINVYKKNQQVGQPENKLKEETDLDEKYQGFEKTERSLAAKGAENPKALAAWIGRKKYGKEKFQKAAAAGKKLKEAKDEREYGYEGDMAITQLKTICRHAEHLMKMLKPDTDLPEWVQAKITKAEDYISTAHDYLMSEMNEAKVCENCGKSPCGCDATEPKDNGKDKPGKRKLLTDKKIQEMATSQNQAIAARIALKHKKEGTMPPKGTASHSMMSMSTKQLHDYTHAEKGAPKKVEESISNQRSSRSTASEKAREKMMNAIERRKMLKIKEQGDATETAITMPSGAVGDTGRV